MKRKRLPVRTLLGVLALVVLLLVAGTLIVLGDWSHLVPSSAPPGKKGLDPQALPSETPALQTGQPSPTAQPAVPPPDGWPPDAPWPPPTQMAPSPDGAEPFPTPAVPPLDGAPATLQTLWYPHYAAPGSVPQMRAVSVDGQGRQWMQLDSRLDLALSPPDVDGSLLADLFPSPDGRWLVADSAFTGSSLVALSSGVRVPVLPDDSSAGEWRFRAWHPDGQQVLALSAGGFALVDLASGGQTALDPYASPEFGQAQVHALAYAPLGDRLADGVVYPAAYGVRDVDVVEIGLVGPDGARESLAQIPGGVGVLEHSLKWSPDGQKLLWIANVVPAEAGSVRLADVQTQLWMVDLSSGAATLLAVLGQGVELGTPAVWSPDGRSIAALVVDEEGANVSLIDVASGTSRPVTRFSGRQLAHLAWSPDGQWLAFATAQGEYGEIWVTSLDGAQWYPIAGPTLPDAPFVWLGEVAR